MAPLRTAGDLRDGERREGLPTGASGGFGGTKRAKRATPPETIDSVFQTGGGLLHLPSADVGVCQRAAAGLRRRRLLALRLLLAVDAQRGHGAGHEAPERDGLAALLAHVDIVRRQARQLLRHL